MKKALSLSIMALGIFALVSLACLPVDIASASTANQLQPASNITYNEDLTVNGTGRFDSVYIGKTTGEGGVTFFNGTMINNSEGDVPLTMGDDLRVDGMIWRGPSKGTSDDMPLKIADGIVPALNNANDFGSSDLKWKDGYFAGDVSVGNLLGSGIINSKNIADGTITGVDISSDANLSVATGTFSGDITAQGDINQNISGKGALKAGVYVINGACSSNYYWTYNNSAISCAHPDTGEYTITFDFVTNQGNLFYNVVSTGDIDDPSFAMIELTSGTPSHNVTVNVLNGTTGLAADRSFILTVY